MCDPAHCNGVICHTVGLIVSEILGNLVDNEGCPGILADAVTRFLAPVADLSPTVALDIAGDGINGGAPAGTPTDGRSSVSSAGAGSAGAGGSELADQVGLGGVEVGRERGFTGAVAQLVQVDGVEVVRRGEEIGQAASWLLVA